MSGGFQPAANPSIVQTQAARVPGRAHVLVIGNEKGGSGKSTTALHIAVALMGEGSRVATLDLDARQGTLSRYIENRAAYAARKGIDLAMPMHASVPLSTLPERTATEADEKARFEAALEPVLAAADFVIVDTPGSDTHLSRTAHVWADTLLTPLNDSFIDLDLLNRHPHHCLSPPRHRSPTTCLLPPRSTLLRLLPASPAGANACATASSRAASAACSRAIPSSMTTCWTRSRPRC